MPTIGWDDETVRLTDTTFFKGELGPQKRIFVAGFENLTMERVHYFEDLRQYVKCNSTYELQDDSKGGKKWVKTRKSLCCEVNAPAARFATVVAVYDVDKKGNLRGKDFDLQIWLFSGAKFGQLKTLNKEFPFKDHDLLITCTDEDFQKLTIMPAKDSLIARDPEWAAEVTEALSDYPHTNELDKFLGKTVSEEDLQLSLGKVEPGPETKSNDEDLDTVMGSITKPKAS